MKELMASIRIDNYPQRWEDIFTEVKYERNSDLFISYEYLRNLKENYGLFENLIDDLYEAGKQLAKNNDHLLFSRIFSKAMKHPDFRSEISQLKICGNEQLLHLSFFFSVLAHIEEHFSLLKKRKIDDNIIFDTLKGYEDTLGAYRARFNRFGYDLRYVNWIMLYLEEKILRIGRFNFEMRSKLLDKIYVFENDRGNIRILIDDTIINRSGMIQGSPGYEDLTGEFTASINESDKYYEGFESDVKNARVTLRSVRLLKDEWHLKLCPDDKVLSVHIPSGGKLTEEICEKAYSDAGKIFKKFYPEFNYKGFFCASWLLDPSLADILPNNSGIVSFQNKYFKYPRKSSGKAVLDFVFHNKFITYDDLPEQTSLQRFLKQHYKSGKFIYEPGGIFF